MSISGLTTNPKLFSPKTASPKPNVNTLLKFRTNVSKVKDCEVKIEEQTLVKPIGSTTTTTTSSSSPPPPWKQQKKKEDEEKQDYYVNLGYAIRSLREEFPELFHRELSFDIYREDITLRDPLNTFKGIENYKSIFWALRFYGKIFFKAIWVDILSVWQPMENVILVRFVVHGIPRVPWESRGRFDGLSQYKLDKNGKIYEHKIDNIALNSPPKFNMLSVDQLIQSISCPSTPKPTCFEFSPPSDKLIPFEGKMGTVRYYLTSALDFARRHQSEPSQES